MHVAYVFLKMAGQVLLICKIFANSANTKQDHDKSNHAWPRRARWPPAKGCESPSEAKVLQRSDPMMCEPDSLHPIQWPSVSPDASSGLS